MSVTVTRQFITNYKVSQTNFISLATLDWKHQECLTKFSIKRSLPPHRHYQTNFLTCWSSKKRKMEKNFSWVLRKCNARSSFRRFSTIILTTNQLCLQFHGKIILITTNIINTRPLTTKHRHLILASFLNHQFNIQRLLWLMLTLTAISSSTRLNFYN